MLGCADGLFTYFLTIISQSFPPAKVIHSGLAVLLATIKGVIGSYDALVELLESIEHFMRRLDIYTKIPPTVALTEIVVKIMVELLSTLALATKQIQQGGAKKFVKKFFGENDVEVVLQRLDRLTQDEARTTAAQTLEVVYGLMHNMRVVMDDGKASADSVRDALELMQKMASDINRLKREMLQQDIRRWLSHGKITTSPANRATTGLRSGSSMATPSRNGNCPDRVPFYGFMANRGPGKVSFVPRLSRTLMPCEDPGSCHWHFSTVTLERIKRRTSAGCSHLC
ncbi:hypothetical protein BJV74DRAFT_413949 [Russula compacta]|nr:hypothetical protein BJV74DRAFT_413949 [Russula compacta]